MVAANPGARVLFVDHASVDGTGALLVAGGATVVACTAGGGLGHAVKTGLRAALVETVDGYVGWLPGNLKSDTADAVRLAATLDETRTYGSTFVKARRVGRPFAEWAPSALAGVVLSLWGLGPYWEVGGTPTVVPATRAHVLLDGPDGIEFETYTVTALRREGLAMLRLPAAFGHRRHGASHWNRGITSQVGLLGRLLREISRTRRHRLSSGR